MNTKFKYVALLLILPLFTVALTASIHDVDAAKGQGSSGYLGPKSYGAKNAGKICGDDLCVKKIVKHNLSEKTSE